MAMYDPAQDAEAVRSERWQLPPLNPDGTGSTPAHEPTGPHDLRSAANELAWGNVRNDIDLTALRDACAARRLGRSAYVAQFALDILSLANGYSFAPGSGVI